MPRRILATRDWSDYIAPVERFTVARVMGIDLGSHRVGVALSDPLGIVAQPFRVIERSARLVDELRSIVDSEGVERIVVGLPLMMNGRSGPAAESAQVEAEELSKELGLPVAVWDERLTTAAAERVLITQGVRREGRRKVIDKIAAAIILQSYLDFDRGTNT